MTDYDIYPILPVVILVAWAMALLMVELFIVKGRKGWIALLTAVGMAVALGFALSQAGENLSTFGGMAVLDGFAQFFNVLFLLSGLSPWQCHTITCAAWKRALGVLPTDYASLSGMMLMSQAADLIVVFLALELLSIPLYVLSSFAYPKLSSEEAGMKYFLLGAFSSGFVLYGIALVYGATATTSISGVVDSVAGGAANLTLLTVGAALMLVGFGFKVAAVPFHMWTPDVYQGAPTPVTAFMSVGAKAAGFATLLRLFASAFPMLAQDLTPVMWGLAAATMFIGNVVAISQTNIKRMLAYSSIAQAGYILMAFVPFGNSEVARVSVAAALFYLFAYMLSSFGAWAVVIGLEKAEDQGLEIASDYAGLGRKYPAMAAAMTVFMLSLTGMPPTLGLVGKFYLFRAVIEGGFPGLAVIGVLTSLMSAYYYLRVVVTMYMREGDPHPVREGWLAFTWGFTAVTTVVLSLVPASLFDWAAQAVLRLF
jgi:NADH-quinone oxidoreductase subunit N